MSIPLGGDERRAMSLDRNALLTRHLDAPAGTIKAPPVEGALKTPIPTHAALGQAGPHVRAVLSHNHRRTTGPPPGYATFAEALQCHRLSTQLGRLKHRIPARREVHCPLPVCDSYRCCVQPMIVLARKFQTPPLPMVRA